MISISCSAGPTQTGHLQKKDGDVFAGQLMDFGHTFLEIKDINELASADLPADPPEGFRQMLNGAGFNLMFGPIFAKVAEKRLILGFRVCPRHLNGQNTCHGGVLASFSDVQAYAAHWQANLRFTVIPTISLNLDYLSPATLGQWVESRTEVVKVTRNMIFSQAMVTADGVPCVRASAIYKIGMELKGSVSVIGDAFGSPDDERGAG